MKWICVHDSPISMNSSKWYLTLTSIMYVSLYFPQLFTRIKISHLIFRNFQVKELFLFENENVFYNQIRITFQTFSQEKKVKWTWEIALQFYMSTNFLNEIKMKLMSNRVMLMIFFKNYNNFLMIFIHIFIITMTKWRVFFQK
jgi:hypothetical protein